MEAQLELRQRADYTHKFNAKTGRHGWLRLTPAYSVKIVEELISQCDQHMNIYDPFCGTATTALSAAYHGHFGVTTDINPFLVWLGQAKTAHYDAEAIAKAKDACAAIIPMVLRKQVSLSPAPPIHKIERWWSPPTLVFLRRLRSAIKATTRLGSPEGDLLLVSFCRTLIACSNAAFNHQSMSFKSATQDNDRDLESLCDLFRNDFQFVIDGGLHNPSGKALVVQSDSRAPLKSGQRKFQRIITSPPYANRMSYIRELRPYMYWLGFLKNGREAGELDWDAIGGTWGIATSRLTDWQRDSDCFRHPILSRALSDISQVDNRSGRVLANYVARYFDDMWHHFQSLPTNLAGGAELHYVVGNSTFYGNLVPVEQLYATMLETLGFTKVECRAIRKRNSKKELVEYDVVAVWPGKKAPKSFKKASGTNAPRRTKRAQP